MIQIIKKMLTFSFRLIEDCFNMRKEKSMDKKSWKLSCFKDSKIPHLIIQMNGTEKEMEEEARRLCDSGLNVLIEENVDAGKRINFY